MDVAPGVRVPCRPGSAAAASCSSTRRAPWTRRVPRSTAGGSAGRRSSRPPTWRAGSCPCPRVPRSAPACPGARRGTPHRRSPRRPGRPRRADPSRTAGTLSKCSVTHCTLSSDACRRSGWNTPGYHPAVAGALAKYVDAFVDGVSADLSELSGRDHRAEVVVEASDLAAAVIDSDTRQTAAELEAWLDDIGPRLEPPVIVTSDRLRESAMLEGKRRWLERSEHAGRPAAARRRPRRWAAGGPLLRPRHSARPRRGVGRPRPVAGRGRRDRPLPRRAPRRVRRRRRRPSRTGAGRGRPRAAPRRRRPRRPRPRLPELPPERPIEALLAELDALVGLDQVKADVRRLTSLLRIQKLREERGLPTLETSHHLVFTGNPGHRQDDRRPSAEPDPAGPRHRVQGPPRRDRPLPPRRRLRRPDGRADAGGDGVRARRDAAHRRGLRAGPGQRAGLRAGGDRHDRQVHGGPPRRPGRHRRRLPGRDGRADRRQPRPEEPLRAHRPLPRLHDRGARRDLRADGQGQATTTSTTAAAPASPRSSRPSRAPGASATPGSCATCSRPRSPTRPSGSPRWPHRPTPS